MDLRGTVRARQDLGDSIDKADRRMDSLAYLLESNVTCVAITIIKGELCVAANLHSGAYKQLFDKVVDFLKDVAKYGQSQDAASILEQIISSRAGISKDAAKLIIPYVLQGDGSVDIARILKEHHTEHGLSPEKIGSAVGVASVLLSDLKKQISFLKDSTSEAIVLAQALSHIKQIDDDSSADIHAEMKLLGYLLAQIHERKIKNGDRIYIGISKLCCLKCASIMIAAKEELSKLNITLEFRGEHDLEKTWGWNPPAGFPQKIFETPDLSHCGELISLIVQRAKTIYDQKSQTAEKKGVSQTRDLSDSSGDEISPEDTHKQYLDSQLRTLELRSRAVEVDKSHEQTVTALRLGLKLHDFSEFKILFYRKEPATSEEAVNIFNKLAIQLFGTQANSIENKMRLFNFLKNQGLAGKYIFQYFVNLTAENLGIMVSALPPSVVASSSFSSGSISSGFSSSSESSSSLSGRASSTLAAFAASSATGSSIPLAGTAAASPFTLSSQTLPSSSLAIMATDATSSSIVTAPSSRKRTESDKDTHDDAGSKDGSDSSHPSKRQKTTRQ